MESPVGIWCARSRSVSMITCVCGRSHTIFFETWTIDTPTELAICPAIFVKEIALLSRGAYQKWIIPVSDAWPPIAWPVKRRMIGSMQVFCVLDYASLPALYILDQLDRAIRKIVCYIAKTTKKKRFRWTVDRSHWLSNETEDCLLAPKKRKCKPFARRVSKHRYCTTKGPARRALIWRINGTSIYPRDHSYHRANPTTPATLRDHSFAFFRKHNPEGLRRSKWNYQIIRGPVTSTGFKVDMWICYFLLGLLSIEKFSKEMFDFL